MISVTRALSCLSDFGSIPPAVLQNACLRGSEVHAAALSYAVGGWVRPLSEQAQPFYNSFVTWFDAYIVDVVGVEIEVVSKKYQYLGHIDMIATIKGNKKPSVIDLKTPAQGNKSWPPQVSAYRQAATESGYKLAPGAYSVRLRKDGGPALAKHYKSQADHLAVFLSCLNISRYINKEK